MRQAWSGHLEGPRVGVVGKSHGVREAKPPLGGRVKHQTLIDEHLDRSTDTMAN